MIVLALSWPWALVTSVAIATLGLISAIAIWQAFAVVVHDDRQTARELRRRRSEQ
jgi:hypothetical protein